MIKAVLFDLDGTLLPMDQDVFVEAYFKGIAAKLAPKGYDPKVLIDGIWKGTGVMINNDGSCSNEEAFWNFFAKHLGEGVREDIPLFDEFYRVEFQEVEKVCGKNPAAADVIRMLKEMQVPVVLATNPIFPAVATESRIRWAGLNPEDFELYTTYENSKHCKPNPDYYMDILKQIDCKPEECIMVGNDVTEDMVTERLGMEVFLLTDCLINKEEKDINDYPHGGYPELMEYLHGKLKYGF